MPEDYRYSAAECLWLADEITDPKHRKSLIEMASAWMRLYEHARKNGQANLSYTTVPPHPPIIQQQVQQQQQQQRTKPDESEGKESS